MSKNTDAVIRLLHTKRFTLHEFFTRPFSAPPYAMLTDSGHSIEPGLADASFHDYPEFFRRGRPPSQREQERLPWLKTVVKSCSLASQWGVEYIWVEECCVRPDTAEVIEAIGSLAEWFQRSTVTLVFLHDFTEESVWDSSGNLVRSLWQSSWLREVQTLRELLFSRELQFYNGEWSYLGSKSTLSSALSWATRISEDLLRPQPGENTRRGRSLDDIPASTKLSWASILDRGSDKDLAYVMMDLCGVSMPVIPDGDDSAFQLLQQEICRTLNDQSVFLWTGDGKSRGLLASWLDTFCPCESISKTLTPSSDPAIHVTKTGIRVQLPLAATPIRNVFAAVLNCRHIEGSESPVFGSDLPPHHLVIFLYRRPDKTAEYVRAVQYSISIYPDALRMTAPVDLVQTDVFVRNVPPAGLQICQSTRFSLKDYPSRAALPGLSAPEGIPVSQYFSFKRQTPPAPPAIVVRLDDASKAGVLLFRNQDGLRFAVCLTLWGWDDIKFGLVANVTHDSIPRLADGFMFGALPQVVKEPGDHALEASFSQGPTVKVSLGPAVYDESVGARACNVSITAPDGFWFEKTGTGRWPNWWYRYMVWVADQAGISIRGAPV